MLKYKALKSEWVGLAREQSGKINEFKKCHLYLHEVLTNSETDNALLKGDLDEAASRISKLEKQNQLLDLELSKIKKKVKLFSCARHQLQDLGDLLEFIDDKC